MANPKIRFKKEDGTEYPDWQARVIGEFANCFAGATPGTAVKEYWTDGIIPWMSSGEVNKKQIYFTDKKISKLGYDKCSTKMVKPNTVVMALAGQGKTRGTVAITRISLCTNQSLCAIETDETVFDDFLFYYLETQYDKLRLISSGDGTRGGLNLKLINAYSISIPCIEEQKKIADFLSNIDEIIKQSEAELKNLEEQKKGAMQKIFSQEVRFKREDGSDYPDWEEKKMSDIFTEIVEKNRSELPVLSILQGVGTVLRDSSERRIAYNKSNLANYKAMQKGDFIIHLRTFEGGLECSNHIGISSPAYKILRTDLIIPEAYKDYFRSYDFIAGKLAVAVTGIRDGKNIDMPTFWEIILSIPCIEEQKKIEEFFSVFDEIISSAKQELEKWKELKNGLLQQMFI